MTAPIATFLMCQSNTLSAESSRRTQEMPCHRKFSGGNKSIAVGGKIFFFFAAVDLILLVGLTVAAARILKGKVAMSHRVAHKMLIGAGAIPLLWTAIFGKYTFCCTLCVPSDLPER